MRVIVSSDPYGASLREAVLERLAARPGVRAEDRGASHTYWEAAHQAAGEVEAAAAAMASAGGGGAPAPPPVFAVLIDSSGLGVCIVANKWPHVFAAACASPDDARTARTAHGANVLCLGARRVASSDEACRIVDVFLDTKQGEGWAEGLQQSIAAAVAGILALDCSLAAAQAAAARGAAATRAAAEAPAAGQQPDGDSEC